MNSRCVVLLAGLLVAASTTPATGTVLASHRSDDVFVRLAAQRLGRQSPGAVARWLLGQRAVRRVSVGADGRTLDIRFRDGFHAAVLPAALGTVRVRSGFLRTLARTAATDRQSGGARAVVLEPFATELSLGPGAGDIEVHDLQSAGFQVDQAYDRQVTVALMASLAQYSVVYTHTHSGPLANGDAALATGQLATGDPSVAPLLSDGSVIPVGVAGDATDLFYAVTSHYFLAHEGAFPHDALLFLNGCDLLNAPRFWAALQTKGVGTMVAWDNEGATSDDYLSAAAFFNQMDTGATVAGALQTLLAAGYGRSQSGGKTATLGYQGNGSLTLAHLAGRVNSPTPTPTRVSPPATSTPAPIATKTPTPTAVSLPRLAAVLRSRVSPGSRQTVAVTSDPRVPVRLTVTYPNGDQLTKAGTTDASGSTRLSYRQRASEITRESSTAHVTVEAGRAPRVTTVQRSYRIGWSAVDVSVEPRVASPGRSVTIWVHARPGTAAKVTVGASHRTLARLAGRTDRSGWARLRYAIPRAQAAGSLLVSAAVSRRSKRFTTSTTLRVR